MGELLGMVQSQSGQLAALQHTTRALENRLALRTQIEALLSHELRTPITVIVGVLQTLHGASRDEPLDDEQCRDLVGRALAQSHYLAEMVDDLLSSDPEHGPTFTRADVRRVRLGDLIDQVFATLSESLPASRVHTEMDRELQVSTAPSRFVAILVNLLENAAKYGGPHVVELRVALHDQTLEVEVGDRGPGLRGESVEGLFELFSRGHAVGDLPGQGIGLYMVRMLAGSLGGTARLEARRGGGLLARVTLPQRRSDDVKRDERTTHRVLPRPETVA